MTVELSHQYQCLAICHSEVFKPHGLLIAATGPKILTAKLEGGAVISQWPEENAAEPANSADAKEEGPPGKKRKVEKAQNQSKLPNVIKLVVSPDQKYAVAVTSDDKCIRVFEVLETGKLMGISQRCMPKRPCAIVVTPDSKTIICGDKFGDVYSLPLLLSEVERSVTPGAEQPEGMPRKAYQPSATELTVHTARNRKALEDQMKQKNMHKKTKEPLKFEHQLLLGHVSMLTDVQVGQHMVDGKMREFILTADRDEHIRISRGIPQAYVIERYCLGHKEFISKMCLVPDTNLVISGGGDKWLGIWDWTTGRLLSKSPDVYMLCTGETSLYSPTVMEKSMENIAVTGIWTVPAISRETGEVEDRLVIIACENIRGLLTIPVSSLVEDKHHAKLSITQMPGWPLSLVVSGTNVIISLEARIESDPKIQAGTFSIVQGFRGVFNENEELARALNENLGSFETPKADDKEVVELLRGTENLRKRGKDAAEDGDD